MVFHILLCAQLRQRPLEGQALLYLAHQEGAHYVATCCCSVLKLLAFFAQCLIYNAVYLSCCNAGKNETVQSIYQLVVAFQVGVIQRRTVHGLEQCHQPDFIADVTTLKKEGLVTCVIWKLAGALFMCAILLYIPLTRVSVSGCHLHCF